MWSSRECIDIAGLIKLVRLPLVIIRIPSLSLSGTNISCVSKDPLETVQSETDLQARPWLLEEDRQTSRATPCDVEQQQLLPPRPPRSTSVERDAITLLSTARSRTFLPTPVLDPFSAARALPNTRSHQSQPLAPPEPTPFSTLKPASDADRKDEPKPEPDSDS